MISDYWKDQTILITGSARGIGKEMAIHFSKLGARVAINYKSSEKEAYDVLDKCHQENTSTRVYRADVAQEKDVQEMFEKIDQDLGPISILINNAGITRDGLLMMMPTSDWKSVMEVHLDGMFYTSRCAIKRMLQLKGGKILNLSSVSGLKGISGQTNYSAAKAGVIGFTKALSREMGPKKITCNALALGIVESDMTAKLDEKTLEKYKRATVLKRFVTFSEINHLAEYICGPWSNYLTGQVITMDGGMT